MRQNPCPDFLIIGAQKSASTFVHECLREHPDVFMPKDEVPIFEDPFYDESKLPEQLRATLVDVRAEKRVGIKRPDYLGELACPARIFKHIPDPQFVVVLRQPVERAVSAYYWYMRMGYLPICPLEAGLTAILDGDYAKQYPKSKEILEYGYYYQHLSNYLSYFERDAFCILLHEDFKEDSLAALRQVYAFLRINTDYTPKSLHKKPKRSIYSLLRIRFSALRNPFIHTYYQYDGNMLNFLPRKNVGVFFVKGVFYALDTLFLRPFCDQKLPPLSHALRDRLLQLYAADVRALEQFLGRDLSAWKA